MTDTDLHKAIGDGEEVVFADRYPFLPTSIIFSEARSYFAFGKRRKLDIVHCNARAAVVARCWHLLGGTRCYPSSGVPYSTAVRRYPSSVSYSTAVRRYPSSISYSTAVRRYPSSVGYSAAVRRYGLLPSVTLQLSDVTLLPSVTLQRQTLPSSVSYSTAVRRYPSSVSYSTAVRRYPSSVSYSTAVRRYPSSVSYSTAVRRYPSSVSYSAAVRRYPSSVSYSTAVRRHRQDRWVSFRSKSTISWWFADEQLAMSQNTRFLLCSFAFRTADFVFDSSISVTIKIIKNRSAVVECR